MTRDEALDELSTMSPRATELVEIVRKAQRGGRPPRKALDPAERRLTVLRAVRAALKAEPNGVLSRSKLLATIQNFGNASALAGVLFHLEEMGEIRREKNKGPKGGRPRTLYFQT